MATRNSSGTLSTTIEITAAPFVDHETAEWCTDASSVTFFDLAPESSLPPRKLLAVGYDSGAIAVFDVTTATLMTITRPHQAPVRRLRFYTAFHLIPKAHPYPLATANSGLLAVFGWSGTVARISATSLLPLLHNPPTVDPSGTAWVIWNLPAQDAVLDVVACGSDPSAICEMDAAAPTAPLRLASAGVNPPIAAYSVTPDPAFSARAAAKRAANTVLSAAKGFLFSRIGSGETQPDPSPNVPTSPVSGVVRHSTSWADDPSSVHGVISFGDVRDTARKSVSAVLRGRRLSDVDLERSEEKRKSRNSGSGSGLNFINDFRNDAEASSEHRLSSRTLNANSLDHNMLTRQRSHISGDAARHTERLPQNARIVERLSASPLPCSLIATCDTLGRVFVQDARDFCVLRVLKGYRDAHVAWLAEGGPLLVIYAPRLNVLEVHGPLEQKRREAFRLVAGSMIVQSASHKVFSVSPEGHLYELMRARKGQPHSQFGARNASMSGTNDSKESTQTVNARVLPEEAKGSQLEPNVADESDGHVPPDYELVGAFTEAIKTGHMSQAIDCLQAVQHDAYKVAHLMATLVTCTAFASTDLHVALSSKASEIAAKLHNPNLLSRFEAHRKLAEAFDLLASDSPSADMSELEGEYANIGKRLSDDDIGAGLAVFALSEHDMEKRNPSVTGKRARMNQADRELINCERFILSHALAPTVDFCADADFELQPRSDLSREEQIWLSKAYFLKLLDTDSVNISTPGREHPTTVEVFLALTDLIGLTPAEITRHFAQFFLNIPLLFLLKTRASLHASPLRCAIARLRSRFPKEVVDPILIDECETTSRVPNAILLTRLCAIHEANSNSEEKTSSFIESLERLGEVLLYRRMITGSAVPPEVYEKFTARRCTGAPGDAERHAVVCLIAANDFEIASKVLTGLEVSRKLQNLDWHESASISEAALHACRTKLATLLSDENKGVIPQSVRTWILGAHIDAVGRSTQHTKSDRLKAFRETRTVLLHAHQNMLDSSVDSVRCLQLAEALSSLIAQEKELDAVAPFASEDLVDMDIPMETADQSETHMCSQTLEQMGYVAGQSCSPHSQGNANDHDNNDANDQDNNDANDQDNDETQIHSAMNAQLCTPLAAGIVKTSENKTNRKSPQESDLD